MTAQIEPKLVFTRPGIAVSFIGHVALLTIGLMFAGANPFESAPADAITVDIVSPNEIGTGLGEPGAAPAGAAQDASSFEPAASTQQATAAAPPQPTAPAQPTAPQPAAPAQPQPTAKPTASARPQQQPATARATPTPDQPTTQQALAPTQALPPAPSSMPWFQPLPESAPPADTNEFNPAEMFGMPLALPDGKVGGSFDAPAIDNASVPTGDIAAFHDRLKTCSRLPAGVNATDNVRAVLRIFLKPDGTLAAPPQPIRIEGVSRGGGDLYLSIVAALRKCQPYNMLPADKYDEWKVFDLTFTPQSFGGG